MNGSNTSDTRVDLARAKSTATTRLADILTDCEIRSDLKSSSEH
jgi:hypothetical protein